MSQAVVVPVAGEIDMSTSHQITDGVEAAVAAGAVDLVLDLSEVTFMDSGGIRALVLARELLPGALTLRSPQSAVRRVLTIAGVIDSFTIEA